jgi:hypothetical protein
MKGSDYDEYITRFESLARKAGYTLGNEETYNIFLQGIPASLLHDTLKPPIPLNYHDLKEKVKTIAQGKTIIDGILKKTLGAQSPFQRFNNPPRPPPFQQRNWQPRYNQGNRPQYNSTNALPSMNNTPVPMDLSRGRAPNNWRGRGNWRQRTGPPARGNVSAPGYDSMRCFNCGRDGHFARNCPERQRQPRNPYRQGPRQANLIDFQEEEEQDYQMAEPSEGTSVATMRAQLEGMSLDDQIKLAKEMGVAQDFPSA